MLVFLDGYKYTLPGTANQMVFDGSALWVALSSKTVRCIKFWGQDSKTYNEETGEYDVVETVYDIDLSGYLTGEAAYLAYGNGSIFVFDGYSLTADHINLGISGWVEIDKTSREVVSTQVKQITDTIHCQPEYAAGKLWFTTAAKDENDSDDKQYVFTYNLSTNQWSSKTALPGKKQFTPRVIKWGGDQYVYVNAFNENAVMKFDKDTQAHLATVTTNRLPTTIFASPNRDLIVTGKDGMVTVVNQTTNAVSNDFGLLKDVTSVFDDGSYLWATVPEMVRLDKVALTDNFRIMDGQDKDFSIESFSSNTFDEILVTPQYIHKTWNEQTQQVESVTEQPRVIVRNGTTVWVAYNLNDSWNLEEVRPYTMTIKCTAMVGTGVEKYHGETR